MTAVPNPFGSGVMSPQTAAALALGRLIISLTFFDRYYADIHKRAAGGDCEASHSLIDKLPYTALQIKAVRSALKCAACPPAFRDAVLPLLSRRMALNEERNRLMHDTWVVVQEGYSLLPRRPEDGYPEDFAPTAVTADALAALTEEVQQMTRALMDALFGEVDKG